MFCFPESLEHQAASTMTDHQRVVQPAVSFWKRVTDQRIQGLAFGPAPAQAGSRMRDSSGEAR